jgi:hypothetical protein
MTITVANTSNTNSFYYWLSRTNELAHALTTYVITTDSNNTTGNAYVNGTFSASILTANSSLSGGNSSTTTVLTISSNANITGTQLSVGSNVILTSTVVAVGNSSVNSIINSTSIGTTGYSIFSINVQTSNTDSQVIDYFSINSYRTADYVISLKNNSANAFQSAKLLIVHNDGNAYVTEYGVLSTNTSLGSFSANANSTHCRLLFTPTAANTQVKGVRTSVVI